ncbi:ATP-dependent Clp protease ATP-binding subunit [Apilactobacillus micheneri]|uniref:AAA family ATPase n=1 Tax=Apilactobacillus micheneri TaxID=1899430 RepID=UPI001129B170|nr:ATP-dependent Clp protease ATP-binding subunit [Apilactobacillus micheneri]TPR49207.1 ATP-dependent Clp protease ATP-binding subunit [Apilactobacillus micheneri]
MLDQDNIPYLSHYAKNVNSSIDNISEYAIGRKNEITTAEQVLLHTRKPNPILIGEAGVGKTNLVQGLAQRIKNGVVPEPLKNFQIYELNLGLLDTNFDGQLGYFNENLSHIIDECTQHNNEIILFIDEIHTIIGASKGNSDQGMDGSQLLKPPLANGSIRLIGATTFDEYHEYIQPDRAFQRRFTPVSLEEPDVDTAVEIIKRSLPRFAKHYECAVSVSDDMYKTMVKLSIRYLTDQFLPDKAFDILDGSISEALVRNPDYKEIGVEVELEDIAKTIYRRTGILTETISADMNPDIINLEHDLKQRIKGQDDQIKQIVNAIDLSFAGMQDPTKPLASFLFLGTAGVGKTETAKALAENIFHDENNMIRLDMGSYTTDNAVTRLIGTSRKAGDLTGAVARRPYSVLLLDEIEKSSSDVRDLLLSILDDGEIQDGRGRTVNFKNEIVVLTSNLGAKIIQNRGEWITVDMDKGEKEYKENLFNSKIDNLLRKNFRPELVDRFDNRIAFNILDEFHMIKITQKYLIALEKRMLSRKHPLHLVYDENVVDYLVALTTRGNNKSNGARPLMRVLQQNIGGEIAHTIIDKSDTDTFDFINTIIVSVEGYKPSKYDLWGKRSFKFKAVTDMPSEKAEKYKDKIFTDENVAKMVKEDKLASQRIDRQMSSDWQKIME